MKRKIVSVLLCVLLLASLLPVSAMADATAGGTCGYNLTWTLDGDGTLTISGTGKMKDYYPSNNDTTAPWGEYCSSIKSVVIGDGVTSIGDYAFQWCSKLKDIAFAGSKDAWASIEKGNEAFSTSPRIHYNCTTLEGHIIPMERKDPSCTSTGYIKYSCACGYEYTELLPQSHDYVFIKSVAATPDMMCISATSAEKF